ncbi:hypothetical protein [Paraclostridium bifermentans]|uniref:hypothetical protein n=1 Tax=Paraclostridium bifermentans TaxID=1490 RepID=UPI00290AB686|nr:hypothetical protein [Paraclostridium bifermentans]MDU3337972.1 hypothetical protein [Paraclostridium bifermentans]
MNEKLDAIMDTMKDVLTSLDYLTIRVNNLENRIIKIDMKNDLEEGVHEIKLHIDDAQIKIRKNVKLVSDKVTMILEDEDEDEDIDI